jgi:hypothetical protein
VCFLSMQMAELGALLNEGIRTGEVQPLPFKVYKADDVPSAFRYMASGATQSILSPPIFILQFPEI